MPGALTLAYLPAAPDALTQCWAGEGGPKMQLILLLMMGVPSFRFNTSVLRSLQSQTLTTGPQQAAKTVTSVMLPHNRTQETD